MSHGAAARTVGAMTTTTLSLTPRPPASVRAVQALLALLGAVVMFGSIYFSAIEPPQEVDAVGWAVGAWAFAMAVAALAVATRLGRPDPAVRRFAIRLLALHFVFGVVKIAGYDEPEAATFMAVDVLLIGLLSTRGARRFFR
jgi:hypothetical protein